MRSSKIKRLTFAALTAAIYAVLGLLSGVFGIAYGPIQCRFSEALCVLPFLFPETGWGLFAGCFIVNMMSAYGPLDMIAGSLATLIAAILTSHAKRRWIVPLPPVIINGVIVGAVTAWMETGGTSAFRSAFLYNAFTIALGEAAACYILGSLLLSLMVNIRFFRELISEDRLQRL